MKKIVVVGEILVEIMADTPGIGFLHPLALSGPFPSGAPAIFIDQVARLGQPCAIVSSVGRDDFGRVNLDRLKRDGVDISGINIDHDRPTGSAFVRYRPDGERDFIFNIRHSACGHIEVTGCIQSVLDSADHLHIMGSSLSSPELVALNLDAAEAVRARGGTVSFDPNIRKEILEDAEMREAMMKVLSLSNIFLPSGGEYTLLTASEREDEAIRELLGLGLDAIVHKQGSAGSRYIDATRDIFVPAFSVTEVDPTGAGDCFGATFVALWLRGVDPMEAMRYAAAAGALAVTRRGPMEGTCDLDTLQAFLRENGVFQI